MENIDPYNLNQVYSQVAQTLGIDIQTLMIILSIIAVWSIIWKGFALWKSARANSRIWFVALLVFNTVGILEILYLFVFSKIDFNTKSQIRVRKKQTQIKNSSKRKR